MNKQEIRSSVRSQTLIEDTNVTDGYIDTLIDLALSEIEVAFAWPFLETSVDITLEEGFGAVAVPSDYSYGAVIIDDDIDARLEYVSPSLFFTLFGNDTDETGTNPICFTIWNDEFLFHPIPSADDADRLTLYYYRTIIELETDGESPEFHKAFHWGIVEYCKWKLWDREEYFDQGERARIIYASYLNDMVSYYQDRIKRSPWTAGDGFNLGVTNFDNLRWLREI